ncbi:hypothetical protein [Virgibacillus sp. JSM 102003]|uniref:hypothetical protein n=1 Tax=Virgibacillus sp. JSM 102003 TaxID=1562108 RepID=UPI0035C20C52
MGINCKAMFVIETGKIIQLGNRYCHSEKDRQTVEVNPHSAKSRNSAKFEAEMANSGMRIRTQA